jgi:F-type H+-transporting ATPase subunit a
MHHPFTWFELVPYLSRYADHEHIHMLTASLVVFIITVISVCAYFVFRAVKKPELPDERFNMRNIFELIGEMLFSLANETMGEKNAKKYFPLLGSMFVFILLNNLIGLIPGFVPATDNLNTTFACGVFVFVYYNIMGFREHGIHYVKQFFGPIIWLAPFMLPIELISHGVRPVSLGLRLFGNMTGDHLVLSLFTNLVPFGVPIPFIALGLFVCAFQALIFVLLTMIYLTLALSHEH